MLTEKTAALRVLWPIRTRVIWRDEPVTGDGIGGEVTGHGDGVVVVKLDTGDTFVIPPDELTRADRT